MDKIWISNKKGEDKIIAIGNDMIYKANPKANKLSEYVTAFNNNDTNSKDIINIPFSYIEYIKYREKKNNILIQFGKDSKLFLKIKDDTKIKEIFYYFKENIPDIFYKFDKYTIINTVRRQLYAFGITLVLFLKTLYIAYNIENGTLDDVFMTGRIMSYIAYCVAHLGVKYVTVTFIGLFTIVIYSMIRKLLKRPKEHSLFFVR